MQPMAVLLVARLQTNQFYSDLVTPLPDGIEVAGTEIHIFYALKMGEKYRVRYKQYCKCIAKGDKYYDDRAGI